MCTTNITYFTRTYYSLLHAQNMHTVIKSHNALLCGWLRFLPVPCFSSLLLRLGLKQCVMSHNYNNDVRVRQLLKKAGRIENSITNLMVLFLWLLEKSLHGVVTFVTVGEK